MIVDSPKVAKLKSLVRRFDLLSRTLHHKYRERMVPLLKRPFPLPLKPNYVSFHIGTIINQRHKKFPAPTSFSLLDLRSFSGDKESDDDDSSETSSNADTMPIFSEDQGVPIHKSNSFYALYCLGRKAELRKPLFNNKLSTKDSQRQRRVLLKREKRGWNALYSSSDESETDREDDLLSETDSNEFLTMDDVKLTINLIYRSWIISSRKIFKMPSNPFLQIIQKFSLLNCKNSIIN